MLKSLLKKEINLKSFGDLFFALWVLAILIFLILMYLASQPNSSEKIYYFMDIDFVAGIAFFVVAIMLKSIGIVKKNLSKTKKELESNTHSTVKSKKSLPDGSSFSKKSFIWGIVLLMGVIAIVQIYTSFDNKKKASEAKITELEGQVRKLKNEYDSQAGTTQPTKVQYQVQDSDPITTCKNDKCGDREMRKSLCELYACCQVGGEWKWVESQTLCYQMQKDYREKEDEKKEQEEKYDEAKYKLDKFIECLDNQEAYYQECVGRCIDTWGENESDVNFINCRGSCLESKIRLKEDLCTKYESN